MFKSIICRLLPKNTFARGVSVLVGGTVGAQILLVSAAPFLTRLYTPEDFGVLAVFTGILALAGVVVSLRYDLAIPLPERNEDAINLIALSLAIVVGMTVATGIVALFFGNQIAVLFDLPALEKYIWIIPLGMFISGVYSVFNYWSVRTKRFANIATTKLYQSISTIVIQFSAFKLGAGALLFGQVTGQGVGAISLVRSSIGKSELNLVTVSGIKNVASRYRRFPIITTWAGLLNSGGNELPPLLLAVFFGATSAGLYALAHRVVNLPMTIIGSAVQSVFLSNIAQAYRENALGSMINSVFDKLVKISMLPIVILAIIGPELFFYVFGDGWRDAGMLARWMTPWLLLQFCTGPLTIVFPTLDKQHIGLLMQAQLFFVRTVTILIGALTSDFVLTVIAYSLGSAISYALFLAVIIGTAKASSMKILLSFVKELLLSILISSPLLIVQILELGAVNLLFAMATTSVFALVRYGVIYKYDY